MVTFTDADVRATVLVRLKLSAVDWLAIDRPETRTQIGEHLQPVIKYLSIIASNANLKHELETPSESLPEDYDQLVSDAQQFAGRAKREGTTEVHARAVVWYAQKKACYGMLTDGVPSARLKFGVIPTFGSYIEKLFPDRFNRALAEVDKFRDAYVLTEDVDALESLINIRVDIAMKLLSLGRATGGLHGAIRQNFVHRFRREMAHSLDEVRCTSPLYAAFASCTLLSAVKLDSEAQSELIGLRAKALGAIERTAAAPLTKVMRKEDVLALPENDITQDQLNKMELLAASASKDAVAEFGPAMLATRSARIAALFRKVQHTLDASRGKSLELDFDPYRAEALSLMTRWSAVQTEQKYHLGYKVALSARVWATLALILRQLAYAAVQHKDRRFGPVYSRAMAEYRQEVAILAQAEDSIGAAHLLRFGSHAISQRTAARYSLV